MKDKKVLLILIFVFTAMLFFSPAGAQKLQDVVFLKNGSILRGEIIKIEMNESITLLNDCGDIWVINQADIEKIEKQPVVNKTFVKRDTADNIVYKRKGFYSNINVGFLFGGDMETPFPPLSLLFVSGYQFDWGLATGVGLGLDLLTESYMPVIADIRYNFRNSRVSHYVYVQGGYAIAIESPDPYDYDYYGSYGSDLKSKGGYLINPGIGFKLNFNERNAFSFGIGYKYSEIYHTYKEYNGQEIERTIKYNRVSLSFGYHF